MRHRRPSAAPRHRARPPEERSLTESREPRLLGSFPRADVALDPPLPEIAFVGRSNVGKSSLLNALLGRRMARISGTPGKTRLLNVYKVAIGGGERRAVGDGSGAGDGVAPTPTAPPSTAPALPRPLAAPHSCYFLDLPGYGYARAGKADRLAFRQLLTHALERPGIAGVVWLLDLRRTPSAHDREMQGSLSAAGTRVLAALTKSDKLPRGQRLSQERALRLTLELDEDQAIATSVTTGDGIAELREAIAGLVGGHGDS